MSLPDYYDFISLGIPHGSPQARKLRPPSRKTGGKLGPGAAQGVGSLRQYYEGLRTADGRGRKVGGSLGLIAGLDLSQ